MFGWWRLHFLKERNEPWVDQIWSVQMSVVEAGDHLVFVHHSMFATNYILYNYIQSEVELLWEGNLMFKLGVVLVEAGNHGWPESILWPVLRLNRQIRKGG